MPYWTPDGIYVDELGNPVYPGDGAYAPTRADMTRGVPAPPPPPPPTPSVEEAQAAAAPLGASGQAQEEYVPEAAPTLSPDERAARAWGLKIGEAGFDPAGHEAARTAQRGTYGTIADIEAERDAAIRREQSEWDRRVYLPQLNSTASIAEMDTPTEIAPGVYSDGPVTELGAELARANTQARLAAEKQKILEDFNSKVEAAYAAGRAVAAKHKAQYEAMLVELQAMRVDPGQLWDQMGKGGQVAALVAIAAGDFLGARGIPTSARATIQRAIDQNIEAQVHNINHKGQVAEGFRTLWKMALEDSASQLEAIEKMRGFHLAVFETYAMGELAKYGDIPAAKAKAAALAAEIMRMRQEQFLRISEFYDRRAQQAINTELALEQMRKEAAYRWAQIDLQRRELDLKEQAMTAKEVPDLTKVHVAPNPDTGEGVGIWNRETYGADAIDKVANKHAESAAYFQGVNEIVKEIERIGNIYDGPGGEWFRSEDANTLKTMITHVAKSQAHADSGMQMTAGELKLYLEQYTPATLLKYRDEKGILRRWLKLAEAHLRRVDAQSKMYIREPMNEVEALAVKAYRGVGTSVGREALNEVRARATSEAPVDDPVDEAVRRIESPDNRGAANAPSKAVVEAWKASGAADVAVSERRVFDFSTGKFAEERHTAPRQWADEMAHMVNMVILDAKDPAVRDVAVKKAVHVLKAYENPNANTYKRGGTDEYLFPENNPEFQQKSRFARYQLERLKASLGLTDADMDRYLKDYSDPFVRVYPTRGQRWEGKKSGEAKTKRAPGGSTK